MAAPDADPADLVGDLAAAVYRAPLGAHAPRPTLGATTGATTGGPR
jgi:hypothetical protein